jgi:hypothetical protein
MDSANSGINPAVADAIKLSNTALYNAINAEHIVFKMSMDNDKARSIARRPGATKDEIETYFALDRSSTTAYRFFLASSQCAEMASAAAIEIAKASVTPLRCTHYKLLQALAPGEPSKPVASEDVYFPKPRDQN